MKINIIENTIVRNGHAYEWPKILVEYFTNKLNHDVVLYCPEGLLETSLMDFLRISNVETTFPSNHKNYNNIERYQKLVDSFKSLRKSDINIITTLDPIALYAYINSENQTPLKCILHYNTGNKIDLWKMSAKLLNYKNLEIKFFTTVSELRDNYKKLFINYTVEKLPYLFNENVIELSKSKKKIKKIKKVGFFGDQREEKGLFLLSGIISKLLDSGYSVLLHDSSEVIKIDNDLEDRDIQLVNRVENLSELISTCDIVITPYNPKMFKNRMSGIAIDTLSIGIPIVCPKGSLAGDLVENFNAGTTFDEFNVSSIMNAFDRLVSDLENHELGAESASLYLKEKHGLSNVIKALLN